MSWSRTGRRRRAAGNTVKSDGLNARQVSDLSHEEAGWRLVDFGEDIPYEAALVGARQVSTPTSQRLEREAAERLGLIAT